MTPAEFMIRVDTSDVDGCWPWMGSRNQEGYGLAARHQLAHRKAFELLRGPIPDGLLVCHHCDNPPCVRPSHLFVGTHADNSADAARKGRLRVPVTKGADNGNALLTNVDVAFIRTTEAPDGEIARILGVEKSIVQKARTGSTYREVSVSPRLLPKCTETTCKRGHDRAIFAPTIDKDGRRPCRACHVDRQQRYLHRLQGVAA